MKVGDLVRIRQGMRYGKLALITALKEFAAQSHVTAYTIEVLDEGVACSYYRRDLEVISESR